MKLSIITPVYNRADCIGRCIESVITNLNCDIAVEHIIVDDGSTDKTVNIVELYTSKYKHIIFRKFSYNKGTNAARNEAVKNASGDYCIILDSDDYFCKDALLTIKQVIQTNPLYNEFLFVPNDREYEFMQDPILKQNSCIITFQDFLLNKISGDFVHVIKTDTMRKYPFDEEVRILEGVFFMRFYRESKKILYVNKIVTIRERGRIDSVTETGIYRNRSAIEKRLKALDLHILWFKSDYFIYNAISEYGNLLILKMKLCIFLEKYSEFDKLRIEIKKYPVSVSPYMIFLRCFRLGKLYQIIFSNMLKIKHSIS